MATQAKHAARIGEISSMKSSSSSTIEDVRQPDLLPRTPPIAELLDAPGPSGREHPLAWVRLRRLCSRWGSPPFLIALDVVALAVGVAMAGDVTQNTFLLALLAVTLFATAGLYRRRITFSMLDDAPQMVGRLIVASVLAASYRRLVGGQQLLASHRLRVLVAVTIAVFAGRIVGYACIRFARRSGLVARRTLIAGAGEVALRVTTILLEHPEYGLEPIAFYDPDPLPDLRRPVPVLGFRKSLSEVIQGEEADVLLITFGSVPEVEMVEGVRTCDRLRTEIFSVPRLFDLSSLRGRDVDHIWGLPVARLSRAPYRAYSWRLKRLVDIAVAGLCLLLSAPLLAAAALAVRLEGGPGIIFRQERVGVAGQPFTILKLRSMKPSSTTESAQRWSIRDDARVGRVGRMLRKLSIDELPQLWNVLRGDMSLVGPRPERPHFVGQFSAQYSQYAWRHRVPSGLTGWAQVHGLRGNTSIEERARFDNFYIENWSLWLDVKIMMQTVSAVLRRRGD